MFEGVQAVSGNKSGEKPPMDEIKQSGVKEIGNMDDPNMEVIVPSNEISEARRWGQTGWVFTENLMDWDDVFGRAAIKIPE